MWRYHSDNILVTHTEIYILEFDVRNLIRLSTLKNKMSVTKRLLIYSDAKAEAATHTTSTVFRNPLDSL